MKGIHTSLPNRNIRIAASIIYGLVFSVLLSYHFLRLPLRSFLSQVALVFGFGIIFGAFFYFLIIPLIARIAGKLHQTIKNGFILVTMLASGLILIYIAYQTTFTPTAHHVEIYYADGDTTKTSSARIELLQIELSDTGIIPLNEIINGQTPQKADKAKKITSLPLPIKYKFFNTNREETINILLSVTPPGRNVIVQLDQQKTYHNLQKTNPDQIVLAFPVYKRYTPIQILLYITGIGSIIAVLFLLFYFNVPGLKVSYAEELQPKSVEKYPQISIIITMILAICFAAGIALLLSVVAPDKLTSSFVQNMVQSTSYTSSDWKVREKVFYVLFYILGFVFSVVTGIMRRKQIRQPLLVSIAILAWIPIINYTAFLVMQADPQQGLWLALCIMSTLFIAVLAYAASVRWRWIGGIGFLILWMINGNQSLFYPIIRDYSISPDMIKITLFFIVMIVLHQIILRVGIDQKNKTIILSILALIVLFIMIFPASLTYIAADMVGDIHAPFHLYVPAIFSRFAKGLTPGYEYFTQYGVGAPYLFSLLLGDQPQNTIYNYTLLMILLLLAFFITTYFLLKRWLNSDGWAIVIIVISLVLQFWSIDRHLSAPSMLVFRYPLFPIVLALLIHWAQKDFRFRIGLLLSLMLGFSIFWTTETGISFLIASCVAIALFLGLSRRSILLIGILCVETVLVFFGLSVIAFGSRVFSQNFIYEGILSPLIIYGSGYGAIPIDWKDGLPYFANLICPILAVTSMGWVFAMNYGKKELSISNTERILLAFCGALTILFSAKYINRAYLQNWHATVLPALIIIGFWLKRIVDHLASRTSKIKINIEHCHAFTVNYGQIIVFLAFVISFMYLLFTPELGSPPTEEGLKSYVTYDSLLNRYLLQIQPAKSGIDRTYWQMPLVQPDDVELIQKYTRTSDPVMLIGFKPGDEWEYYVAAKRLPASPVVPTEVIFSRWQTETFIANIPNIIFLPYREKINEREYIKYPELDAYLRKNVIPHYSLIDEGEALYVYRKK